MRKFVNKVREMENNQPPFNFAVQICRLIEVPSPGEGLNYAEIKHVLEILDLIQTLGDGESAVLEEADWVYLNERLAAARFLVAHQHILDMVDYVKDLSKHTVVAAVAE